MKMWLRKSLIVLVSILTFGVVTPSHALWSNNQDLHKSPHRDESSNLNNTSNVTVHADFLEETTKLSKEEFIAMMTSEAERQSILKFGPKITSVIEDEFRDIILPKIEQAIEMTVEQFPEASLDNLAITEKPAGGVSEKIFHIYQTDTNKDIIRFHVRRDKPPLEGYTFNFHYHTYDDQFQTHYALGNIYWDKNTPPKWQTM